MAVFEKGQLDDISQRGWIVGQFAREPFRTDHVEVKWAHERKGSGSLEWRRCETSRTFSVLISGRFKIEFRGGPDETVIMEKPGDYVLFGPDEKSNVEHRSIALEDSDFLTIRWPSIEGDCLVVDAHHKSCS
jgi:hypothetical protein